MMIKRSLRALAVLLVLQYPALSNAGESPLMNDFGGREGLVTVVDDFMVNLLADERTRPFFEPVNQEHLKTQLVNQFCALMNGPCEYTGADMESAHRGMDIDKAQFNALVEALQIAMDDNDVPFRSQNKLLAMLAPMHDVIISE